MLINCTDELDEANALVGGDNKNWLSFSKQYCVSDSHLRSGSDYDGDYIDEIFCTFIKEEYICETQSEITADTEVKNQLEETIQNGTTSIVVLILIITLLLVVIFSILFDNFYRRKK